MARRGVKMQELADILGVSRAAISQARRGVSRPRWERGDAWADALTLRGKEREQFLDALCLEWTPPRIRAKLDRAIQTGGRS